MIATDELVKKFDNFYPVKTVNVKFIKGDGSVEVKTLLDVDYSEASRIRATMTPAERERQRSVL